MELSDIPKYRNFDISCRIEQFDISYRIEKSDIWKYRTFDISHRTLFALHPLCGISPCFFTLTLNESIDLSNIGIVHLVYRLFLCLSVCISYRIRLSFGLPTLSLTRQVPLWVGTTISI